MSRSIFDYIKVFKNIGPRPMAQGPRIGFKEGNGVYDEKDLLGKRVRELMDEGYEFGEAVRQAMKEGYATGGRAGFAGGGMGRRAFLKLMAALGATGVAAKSGLVSLLGKGKGKQVAKELTQVPIKQTSDMPAWFKPLVNKVIKEGEDVTKQNAFKE